MELISASYPFIPNMLKKHVSDILLHIMSGNLFGLLYYHRVDTEHAAMRPRPSTMTEESNKRMAHSLEGLGAFVERRL